MPKEELLKRLYGEGKVDYYCTVHPCMVASLTTGGAADSGNNTSTTATAGGTSTNGTITQK